MKAVVFLALIGLASCRLTFLRDVDRDVKVKYSFDDDFDREVEVDYDDRPQTFLREFAAPVVQQPNPIQFVQAGVAPTTQFRTNVVGVELPRPVAPPAPVFTQQQVVPAAPQSQIFVLERAIPKANVVTQFANAGPIPVVASTSVARHQAPAAPLVVEQARPTLVTERRHFFTKSKDDSLEE
ncbi:uncharacterized protein [Macrobrachium rosenbergii]|uniref:uncharacterized protein n=1 Tax=Macrobrachium rosenbergii TaxID=79674 RepID=UPI0034D5C117